MNLQASEGLFFFPSSSQNASYFALPGSRHLRVLFFSFCDGPKINPIQPEILEIADPLSHYRAPTYTFCQLGVFDDSLSLVPLYSAKQQEQTTQGARVNILHCDSRKSCRVVPGRKKRLTFHFTSCKSHGRCAVKHIAQSNTWDVNWFVRALSGAQGQWVSEQSRKTAVASHVCCTG